jgi:squalene-associated FAD-dependent desaturase
MNRHTSGITDEDLAILARMSNDGAAEIGPFEPAPEVVEEVQEAPAPMEPVVEEVAGHRGLSVAIIGAGWAGLAAASDLRDAGIDVTVYEASHTPGGRAKRVDTKNAASARPLDNGQHMLLGAYTQTLALMRRLGQDPDRLLRRVPLALHALDGRFRLHAPRLQAPWHGLAALATAHGLGLTDRLKAIVGMAKLRQRGWAVDTSHSVTDMLNSLGQTPRAIQMLWEPLCLASLNTPPAQASAVIFARVLRDSLDGATENSDMLIPRTDLSSLWADAAAKRCDMRYGVKVQKLHLIEGGVAVETVTAEGVDYVGHDAVIVATPPGVTARMLPDAPEGEYLLEQLAGFQYLPIATLSLRFSGPVRLPVPMMMLHEDPSRMHVGQWVFDRGALMNIPARNGELSIVVSAREALTTASRDDLISALIGQLVEQWGRQSATALPPVLAYELFIDKRATFASVRGLGRPGVNSPWERIMFAGDWTDTGYPSVLEGAVRSGVRAAQKVVSRLQ